MNADIHFFDNEHADRCESLIQRDNTAYKDQERNAMFYIIAGNEELYRLQDNIYDFAEHSIKPEVLETPFCSSTLALIRASFSLYNGDYFKADIAESFYSLDKENSQLLIEALKIRYLH